MRNTKPFSLLLKITSAFTNSKCSCYFLSIKEINSLEAKRLGGSSLVSSEQIRSLGAIWVAYDMKLV